MQKIIAIVGPTATGKSDLAVRLAKKLGGEVISADSRQIFKGMDIGTGKITKPEMQGIPHHLLSFVSPKTKFSAEKFKTLAQKKITEISRRGKIPIIAGGNGYWIDALLSGLQFPEVAPNWKLRKQLENKSAIELFLILKKMDAKRAAGIDQYNPARLIRAIEIAKKIGKVPQIKLTRSAYDLLFLGLDTEMKLLEKKISTRLEKRIRRGMVAEVKKLRNSGISWQKLEDFGLEYRYVSQFLQKKLNAKQFREQLFIAIRQYAKRQRTWFKRNKKIVWIDARNPQAAFRKSLAFSRHFLKR